MTGDHCGRGCRRESASQQVMGCNFSSDGEKSIESYKNTQHGSNFLYLPKKHALMTDIIGNGKQKILISGKMPCVYPQKNRTNLGHHWVWSWHEPTAQFQLSKAHKAVFYMFWSKTQYMDFICLSQNLFCCLNSQNLWLLIQVLTWTEFTKLQWQLTTKIIPQLAITV